MTDLIQIGLGPWGLDWATTILPQIPDAVMVGWVDADPTAREAFHSTSGVSQELIFASVPEAFARTSAVGAIAPVAIKAHAAVAQEVLDANRHLLIEKPFTLDVATARHLAETAATKGVVLAVDQNYRYFPGAQALRSLLDTKTVGEVRHIGIRWHRQHAGVRASDPLIELSVHHFDLMRYVLRSEATKMTVSLASREPDRAPESRGLRGLRAIIEFASGDIVDYSLTSAGVAPTTPWPALWTIAGDDGNLEWGTSTLDGSEPDPHSIRQTSSDGVVRHLEVPPLPLFERAGVLRAFLDAIEHGTEPSSPAADNARTIAMLEAATRSRASGRPEQVAQW